MLNLFFAHGLAEVWVIDRLALARALHRQGVKEK